MLKLGVELAQFLVTSPTHQWPRTALNPFPSVPFGSLRSLPFFSKKRTLLSDLHREFRGHTSRVANRLRPASPAGVQGAIGNRRGLRGHLTGPVRPGPFVPTVRFGDRPGVALSGEGSEMALNNIMISLGVKDYEKNGLTNGDPKRNFLHFSWSKHSRTGLLGHIWII